MRRVNEKTSKYEENFPTRKYNKRNLLHTR